MKDLPTFDQMLKDLDKLTADAHRIVIRHKFIDRFGVTPEAEMGDDWEDHIEEYYENANAEDERIDK